MGPGGIVTFTVTVHNTGDVTLSVQVTNDLSNECAFAVTDPPLPVELYAAWRSDNENPALPPFLDLLRPAAEPEDLDALEDPAFEPD